jgi:O-antigen/teichoic acid export membrane protein
VLLIVALNYFSPAWMNPFTGVVLINALIPVIVWSGVSVYVYTRLHPELIPAIQHIDWTQTRTLLQVGLSFTVLQLYGIAIFFTDNILIAYLFGAESVTEYSIINKYFSVLTLFFGMILMPYWSAIAVTYAKNDTKGTLKLMRVVLVAFLALSIGGIVLFVMKDYAVRLWTKLDVSAYFYLSVWVLLSTLLAMFNNIYTILLNSANKLRLQVVMAILVIILNPVLSIVAVKVLHYPIEAIPIVNVFCMFLFGLMAYIQATKVMQNRAVGIWNK